LGILHLSILPRNRSAGFDQLFSLIQDFEHRRKQSFLQYFTAVATK
jgi:hypothetical protein